jgi:hypothetical protein
MCDLAASISSIIPDHQKVNFWVNAMNDVNPMAATESYFITVTWCQLPRKLAEDGTDVRHRVAEVSLERLICFHQDGVHHPLLRISEFYRVLLFFHWVDGIIASGQRQKLLHLSAKQLDQGMKTIQLLTRLLIATHIHTACGVNPGLPQPEDKSLLRAKCFELVYGNYPQSDLKDKFLWPHLLHDKRVCQTYPPLLTDTADTDF